MIEKEKVSIIIPIYNAEKYLEDCVNSVIDQTYSNLQIILVNDGSTDKSWNICQRLKGQDNRIEIFSQSNSGVSVARNKGLDVSNGKWIMFVDPDDFLDEDIVTDLVSKMDDNTDIVSCACYGIENKKKYRAHFFKKSCQFSTDKIDLFLQLLNVSYGQTGKVFTAIGVPWGKIYRKTFLEKNNLKFDPALRRMQDNIFNMSAFFYARNIIYLDKPLYYYRLNNIGNYNDRHLNELNNIFLPVIRERYYGLNDIGLFSNPQIYKSYINETANMFLELARGEFLTTNRERFNDYVHNMMEQPYFKDIFKKNGSNLISNKKVKLILFLIKHHMYYMYMIYKKFKKKIGK